MSQMKCEVQVVLMIWAFLVWSRSTVLCVLESSLICKNGPCLYEFHGHKMFVCQNPRYKDGELVECRGSKKKPIALFLKVINASPYQREASAKLAWVRDLKEVHK